MSQYRHRNPNASLLGPAELDDLEIFGTTAEAEAGVTSARSSCNPPKSRAPQAIPPGESAANGHQNHHEPESQSTKSARQLFCGCGFSTAFSEISKMVHWRLGGCGKEVHDHFTNRHQYVSIPNNDEDGVANSVEELTPLLIKPRKKPKAARKPNVATKIKKIRVVAPVIDNMRTSATKVDGLIHDDNQGSSTVPPSRICHVAIDFGPDRSNVLRISSDDSYAQSIQPSPPTTPTELSPMGSLERLWKQPPPDAQSGRRLHFACVFSPWNENDQVPVIQDQFNYTRSQQQPRMDVGQHVDRQDQPQKPGKKPSRFNRTRDRFRASLASLPGFLSNQVMTSISTAAIPPSIVSSRKSPHGTQH